jgi:O-acetyl-ADP-ribose deacetylase (regulator of RNase III)
MVIVCIIDGDLLDSSQSIIAHQCNCVTSYGKGLSAAIFAKYPYADVYSSNSENRKVGHIDIRNPKFGDVESPIIIAIYAQYKYGKSVTEPRLTWFQQCLDRMIENGITDVAMPYGIGCGLAGGNWADYKRLLSNTTLSVTLFRKI